MKPLSPFSIRSAWNQPQNQKNQKGAVTLTITIILLVALTIVSMYTSKVLMTELKISANELRIKASVEAADAGIVWAIDYFQDEENPSISGYDYDNNESYDKTMGNGSSFSASFQDLPDGQDPPDYVVIISTGTSDDDIIKRTISRVIRLNFETDGDTTYCSPQLLPGSWEDFIGE